MTKGRRLAALAAVLLFAVGILPLDRALAVGVERPPDSRAGLTPERAESTPTLRTVVRFRADASDDEARAALESQGLRVVETIPALHSYVVESEPGLAASTVASVAASTAYVEFAEPDEVVVAAGDPNDPDYPQQWFLQRLRAPSVWSSVDATRKVKVAILDSGVDADHPDLAGRVIASRNFTSSPDDDDHFGHGTHVAGTVGAVVGNGQGGAGLAVAPQIISGKVISDKGSGYYSWLAAGLVWAADQGAQVINLSLVGSSDLQTLRAAVDYAQQRGAIVVAAAGNSNSAVRAYPAALPGVLSVGSIGRSGARSSFSNYGEWVEVAAPGEDILSTVPNHPYQDLPKPTDPYGAMSGTSMATAVVSGGAALIWATPHGSSASSVLERLAATADGSCGAASATLHGCLDLAAAVGVSTSNPTDGGPAGHQAAAASRTYLPALTLPIDR